MQNACSRTRQRLSIQVLALNGRLSQRGRKLASSMAANSRSGLLRVVARLYEVRVPIRLRPVADDELASFVASTRDGYLISLVNDAGMGEEEAHEKTERDFAMLVREGLPVAGQQLFIVEETETSEPVGRVWLGERFPGSRSGFSTTSRSTGGSVVAVSAARRCCSSSRRRAVAGSSRSG